MAKSNLNCMQNFFQKQDEQESFPLVSKYDKMNKNKILQYQDKKKRSYLVKELLKGNNKEVEKLIEFGFNLDNETYEGKNVVDLAYENKNFDIVLTLLENNSKFPRKFNADETGHEGLKKFAKLTREFHSKLMAFNGVTKDEILKYKNFYPKCKYFYGLDDKYFNRSVAFVALDKQNKQLFDLFQDCGLKINENERNWCPSNVSEKTSSDGVFYMNAEAMKKENLSDTLCNRSYIGNSVKATEEGKKKLERVKQMFEYLVNIKENENLLRYLTIPGNFTIMFDFTKPHSQSVDINHERVGHKYIYIGAQKLLEEKNDENSIEIYGSIMKELSRFIMEETYENFGKPYQNSNTKRKEEFMAAFKESKQNKRSEKEICNVFKKSYKHNKEAELISTVPQLFTLYATKPTKLEAVKKNFPKLFMFFEDNVKSDVLEGPRKTYNEIDDIIDKIDSTNGGLLKNRKFILLVVGLFILLLTFAALALFFTFGNNEPETYPDPIFNSSCGHQIIQNLTGKEYIAGKGAQDSYPGQWPWLGALFQYFFDEELKSVLETSKNYSYICSSSLISPWHLLTAAHCTQGQPEDYFVLLGRYNLTNELEKNSIRRNMVEIFNHPDYDVSAKIFKSKADIAVMKMEIIVEFNDFIQPICIPEIEEIKDKTVGFVAGYGKNTELRIHENIPKYTKMEMINSAQCFFEKDEYSNIISAKSFCGKGGKFGATPCSGDSGGGIYIQINPQQYMIAGTVSQGLNAHICNPKDMVVFVNATDYKSWIIEKISICNEENRENCVNPCDFNPCGKNTECKVDTANKHTCSCIDGFKGDPVKGCKKKQKYFFI